jgi:flagellar biosynthesis/type III secretory pathway protein FliH
MSSLSKIIKIQEHSENEARWVKYRRETLEEQKDRDAFDPARSGQPADPARLMADAREEAERIRREAYESGFGAGREEGLEKTANEMQSALLVLKELAHQLEQHQKEVLKQIEPDVVRLAVGVAEKIVAREVAADRDVVKRCVARAIEKILEREKLVINVNPVDLPVVMQYKEELLGMFDGIKEIEVVGSENGISPGGCTVETDLLKANGKIEAQLEEILQGLLA